MVWGHYDASGRGMPWRSNTDPYWILVSEIMLQQTQVSRVIPKFEQFITAFPSTKALANASFADVLQHWSGLGYNRRAKFLWQTAQIIQTKHGGNIPNNRTDLAALPGIGPNTAGSIMVYAFNQPEVYIETNIRSIFIHHFFNDRTSVDDTEILPLISETMSRDHPRAWYWALMDYGSYLKKSVPNPSRASKHHTTQTRFEGSTRQLRGKILRELSNTPIPVDYLRQNIRDDRFDQIVSKLREEGMIKIANAKIYI